MTALTARTDAHRPGAMNPTAYEVLAVAVLYTEENMETGRDETVYELDATSDRWANEFGSISHSTWAGHREDQCDHCGAHVKYTCIVLHKESGDIITVGRDCVSRFFNIDWSNRAQLAAARHRRENNIARILTAFPEAETALYWALDPEKKPGKFAADIAEKGVVKGFNLSAAQVGCLVNAYQKSLAPIAYATGKQQITGVIVKCTAKKDDYKSGRWATFYKYSITVQTASGLKVWGTLPAAIADDLTPETAASIQGREVSFSAIVEANSASFATYSRPTKFVISEPAPAPETVADPLPEAAGDAPAVCDLAPVRTIGDAVYPSDDAPTREWRDFLRANRPVSTDAPLYEAYREACAYWNEIDDARDEAAEAAGFRRMTNGELIPR